MPLTTGLQLPFGVQPVNPVPVDSWSGPYSASTLVDAISAANTAIPSAIRFQSMQVRLVVSGTPYIYWYKDGISDSDLVSYIGSLEEITASNILVKQNLWVSGSIYASVFSSSYVYITSSQLVVTDNIITLNALSPYVRYAGLEMYDSGSGTLSSLLWDSQNNYFFVSSSDAGYVRQVILGPDLEKSLIPGYIPLISSSNSITSSIIYQQDSTIVVSGNITASSFTSSVANGVGFYGTSSWAVTSSNAMAVSTYGTLSTASIEDILYIIDKSDTSQFLSGTPKDITAFDLFNSITVKSASYSLSSSYSISGSYSVTSSYALTSSYSLSSSYSISGSYALTSSYSEYAATAAMSQNAQDILIYVKNTSGAIIPKGKVVRIVEVDNSGNVARIELADYSNENNSANTLGFTNESFDINAFGYVMTEGYLTGVNTDGFNSGDLLFLSSSGTYTNITPIAPKHGVRLGQAIRIQQNNGSIYVRIDNGAEIGELHDVIDSTTTSSYGDLLVKSGSVWVTGRSLSGSYTLTGSINAYTASFNYLNINNTGSAPSTPLDPGKVGEIRLDNNFIYLYTNQQWVRVPVAKWTV
jgi:hypothetical protein